MVRERLTSGVDGGTNATMSLLRADARPVDWWIADTLIDYDWALAEMKARALAIARGEAAEAVWLIEHPPLYTAGTSSKPADLISPDRFPVYEAGRGGQYTYHGPGQRVAYVMLDLTTRGRDIRRFVATLEDWVIATLAAFNVTGERRADRIGVWVRRPERGPEIEDKIAAIGVRVSKWVSFHGLSLNVSPDLDHFSGIVPCGISDHGVTSLEDLGHLVSLPEVDTVLKQTFEARFGATRSVQTPEPAVPRRIG